MTRPFAVTNATPENRMLDFTSPNTPTTPPAITAAAGFVASATARFEAAKGAQEAAQKNAAAVRSRVAALEAERADIVRRRTAGQQDEGDAGRLTLIAADLEGLGPLVAEAEAAVAEARRKAETEDHLVANARAQLDRAEAEARLAALVTHAQQLDVLLTATLGQVAEVAARIGAPGRPPWAPTPGLVLAIRKHAAAHGLL
jgi:hypothetical protein